MKKIIVLRHADHEDGKLTKDGIAAFNLFISRAALPELRAGKRFTIYCAPSERTQQTAELVSNQIKGATVTTRIVHQLSEAMGDIAGAIEIIRATDDEYAIVVAHKPDTQALTLDLLQDGVSVEQYGNLVREIQGLDYCQAYVVDVEANTYRLIYP